MGMSEFFFFFPCQETRYSRKNSGQAIPGMNFFYVQNTITTLKLQLRPKNRLKAQRNTVTCFEQASQSLKHTCAYERLYKGLVLFIFHLINLIFSQKNELTMLSRTNSCEFFN